MRNIAVLVPDFAVEHCVDFMEGVNQYFATKDVTVYYAHTKFQKFSEENFDYQYWTSAELLKSYCIDAYIVLSGVFCSIIPQKDYFKLLKGFCGRPVISASIKVDMPGCVSVTTDCGFSYHQIVEHLVKKHGCRRIAFLSANSTGSSEAILRFEAYKKALAEFNIPYDENIVFDGQFNEHEVIRIFEEKFKSRNDIDFDALISANDVMATGALKVFNEIGVKIPDDVKIIGFDDSVFASLSTPRLSTVNQNIVNQGMLCAQLAEEILDGKEVPPEITADLKPVFRQSCGCLGLDNLSYYLDANGNCCKEKNSNAELLNLYMTQTFEKKRYISLLDLLRSSNTLRQFFFNIRAVIDIMMIDEMKICLYKEPFDMGNTDEYSIPHEAELAIYANVKGDLKVFRTGEFFDPHKEICVASAIPQSYGAYIVYPVYSGSSNYGYILAKPRRKNFFSYTVNMKILSAYIAQSVEYTMSILQKEQIKDEKNKLEQNNEKLMKQNKTDELTGILNRRGFLELGQRTLDVMQEMEVAGIVFFADIDRLKSINDIFGHAEGDRAIQFSAKVLKKAFRQSDVVGRLSGDEFGIVASGMDFERVEKLRQKVDKLCETFTQEFKLPYKLSISLGASDLCKSSQLSQILTVADKNLYEIKREKHKKL